MERTDLTQYDIKPEAMVNYLRYNGPHFNSKLLEFAVSHIKAAGDVKITPFTKQEIDQKLKFTGTILKQNQLYDHVFVANMCKADFLESSILDEAHLILYVKDVMEDPDAYEGMVFTRFYADCIGSGTSIDWEDMI